MNFLDLAKLAVQTALLGEITPEMRVITVEAQDDRITIRVYNDQEASDDLEEDLDAAGTEVHALLPQATSVTIHIEHNAVPGPIQVVGWPVYARKGTGSFWAEDARAYGRE